LSGAVSTARSPAKTAALETDGELARWTLSPVEEYAVGARLETPHSASCRDAGFETRRFAVLLNQR